MLLMGEKINNLNVEILAERLSGNVAAHARKLGISRQHLNNILKGRRQASGALLLKIQTVYEIPAADLLKDN